MTREVYIGLHDSQSQVGNRSPVPNICLPDDDGCMSSAANSWGWNTTRSLKAKLHGATFRSQRYLSSASEAESRSSSEKIPILQIPSASIFRFSGSNANRPTLDLDWSIHEGESWVIIGNAGEAKLTLLEVKGRMPGLVFVLLMC